MATNDSDKITDSAGQPETVVPQWVSLIGISAVAEASVTHPDGTTD